MKRKRFNIFQCCVKICLQRNVASCATSRGQFYSKIKAISVRYATLRQATLIHKLKSYTKILFDIYHHAFLWSITKIKINKTEYLGKTLTVCN